MSATDLRAALWVNARDRAEMPALTVFDGGSATTLSWSDLASAVGEADLVSAVGEADHGSASVNVVASDNGARAIATMLALLMAGNDVAVFEAGGPRPAVEEDAVGGAADPVVYQSTSGSTGEPRLVRQRLSKLLRGAHLYREIYGLSEMDRVLTAVPTAHSFGMVAGLFAAVISGAHLTTLTRFSPRAIVTGLDGDRGASVMLGTPLVYELVSRTVQPGPRRLRVALSSGGPIDARTAAAAAAVLGVPVLQVYGSTETGLIAAQRRRREPWPEGCVGVLTSGVDARIVDGRLQVRTSTMFDGYAGPAALSLVDGFFETGDVAELDGSGNLRLLGRKETFINVGGRKVNPIRVQRHLEGYLHVRESAVYGVESLGGQEVHAAVVLDSAGTVEGLVAHCHSRLARYEVPHRVHLLPSLPRNGMGKVDRGRLPGVK